MKGVPFSILPPGTEEDENDLEKSWCFIDERFASMNPLPESKQSSRVAQFFEMTKMKSFNKQCMLERIYHAR